MINVVLVEPKGEENVGAVARAMLNTGVKDLILVNPRCDYLSEKSLLYSVHSKDVLQNAMVFDLLENAVKGSDVTIAVTRRTGSWRNKDFDPSRLSEFLTNYKDKKISLVFGREENGLTTEEIASLDLVCSIPTSDDFPSMNLSHAVIVVLYEIYKTLDRSDPADKIVSRKDFDETVGQIYKTLEVVDFYKNPSPWIIKNFIKKILLRAKLETKEAEVIKNVFKSLEGIFKRKK